MRGRLTLSLLTVLAVAAVVAPPLPERAGAAAAWTRTTLHVDVVVGPDDDTHCDIVADLYRPAAATRSNRAPAVLTTHGFGGSKDDQATFAGALAERGYVVLSYSGLGFGGSTCRISLDDPDWDGKAGKQLVDFLAGTKAATDGTRVDFVRLDAPGDPRVGMVGGSYGGQVQFAVAGIDQRLDALIPLITWNDLAYSLAPNNTSFARGVTYRTPGVYKKVWTSFFFGAGILDGLQHATVDPARLSGCPNFRDQVCPAKTQLDLLGYPTEPTLALARHASVASYARRITAPTLLVQGQADSLFNLQEAVATYQALRRAGTTVHMIWQYWGHSDDTAAPGELDLSRRGLATSYLGQRFLGWFDHWLKDAPGGTGPVFSYFRDWVDYTGNAAPAYAHASSYPVSRTRPLYLSGTADLVGSRAAVVPGSQSYANAPGGVPTSYSETSAAQGRVIPDPLTPVFDTPGTFAAWTTAPLRRDLVTVGVPTLEVRLDSPAAALTQYTGPAGQLVLFAKLYAVAPDGTVTLQHRLVSPVRVADVTRPVRIQLPGVVQCWPAGHRIRLVLAASDASYAGNTAVLPVTVHSNPADPGVLRLPVVDAPGNQC